MLQKLSEIGGLPASRANNLTRTDTAVSGLGVGFYAAGGFGWGGEGDAGGGGEK